MIYMMRFAIILHGFLEMFLVAVLMKPSYIGLCIAFMRTLIQTPWQMLLRVALCMSISEAMVCDYIHHVPKDVSVARTIKTQQTSNMNSQLYVSLKDYTIIANTEN